MKAILFDLYETLITEREGGRNRLDVGTPECESPAAILGLSDASFEKEWHLRRPDRMTGVFRDYFSVLHDICQKNSLDVEVERLHKLNKSRAEAKKMPYQKIGSEILTMLQALKGLGLKIGLVSNCSAEETEAFFSTPLYSLIDECVLSYQVGIAKPNRDIYLLACQRLTIEPSECLFIGDGGANELLGAEEAGIQAYRAKWFYDREAFDDRFPSIEKPGDIITLVNTLKKSETVGS